MHQFIDGRFPSIGQSHRRNQDGTVIEVKAISLTPEIASLRSQ